MAALAVNGAGRICRVRSLLSSRGLGIEAGFMLLDGSDDLLFCLPATLHIEFSSVLVQGENSPMNCSNYLGKVTTFATAFQSSYSDPPRFIITSTKKPA